ncbi:hypothetical protein PIB30_058055 [Stylosanthes scabra]|uniref:Uncharacterized protein n=1 Tax=Stylosanthes scabra TaxID=79078 RepID=A0ABU6YJ60_9FABA|nr:hypothetical protein [Stylosanthes scabra]
MATAESRWRSSSNSELQWRRSLLPLPAVFLSLSVSVSLTLRSTHTQLDLSLSSSHGGSDDGGDGSSPSSPAPSSPSLYSLLHGFSLPRRFGDAKIPAIKDDTLIPQEPPIMGVAMTRTRETRARNPRQARQEAPPKQQPPQEQPQPQVHHQQDFPPNFYTHFDASMSQIYKRLDQQQEESRKSFEAINTRMDRMDDQISFLQFKEMEMQGIPVTMANLAIHRQKEEEMNQERMRYDQILQEAAAQQAKEANKGKAREVVPDSEEELASSASEEW